jgi:phosphohistidine phosphatase
MLLHIVRHGIAIDREDPDCPPENERYLTEEGLKRTREVGRGLRKIGVTVDRVLTSPLVRARQTAEIIAEELGVTAPLTVTAALSPGFTIAELGEALMKIDRADSIMIVGHEPDLSELISMLVWGDDSGMVEMKKAAAALVELDSIPPGSQSASLRWLLPPKVLTKL